MTGLYASMSTSKDLENKGIWLDLDHSRILLARAGGQNVKFNAAAERIANEHRRVFQHGLMSSAKGKEILRKLYADTVVLDWLTKTADGTLDGEGAPLPETVPDDTARYTRGIGQPDGTVGEFNKANVIKVLTDLDDLLVMVKDTAESLTYYRKSLVEDVTGN